MIKKMLNKILDRIFLQIDKEIQNRVSSISKDSEVLYNEMSELRDLLEDIRKDVLRIPVPPKENDIVVYTLSNGIEPKPTFIPQENLKNGKSEADNRMKIYRELQMQMIEDMNRKQEIFKAEAQMYIENIKRDYGVKD